MTEAYYAISKVFSEAEVFDSGLKYWASICQTGQHPSAEGAGEQAQGDAVSNEMMAAMMEGMPLRQLVSFVPGVTKEALDQLIMALNN